MKKLYLEQKNVQKYDAIEKVMKDIIEYKVIKVVNAIDPIIGTILHKDFVYAYCEDVDWIVDIK